MTIMKCLGVNDKGNLTIGGCDTIELAGRFGTPLYVMDENTIRDNCRAFTSSIEKYYNGHGRAIYAGKAFCCMEMCRIIDEEGLGLDVVSAGEIYTALKAGFPPEKMYFHGNNKSDYELELALENSIGRIVVDNLTELNYLNFLAGKHGKTADIMLRIKPGIDAHTHDFVKTGSIDSKFGLALETGEALEAVKAANDLPNIKLWGLHCHIGSQIFDTEPFELAARVMLEFMAQIRSVVGITLEELNLGGGFGIKYTQDDDPTLLSNYMEKVSQAVKQTAKEHDFPVPFICIEPGRSIVGGAGITLYTVGFVKDIPGARTYVCIDGGMTDNPRYALYRSQYTVMVANRAAEQSLMRVTIAGKTCESGDIVQEDVDLPCVEDGDIIAVLATGAYNYSMASNYNRLPRPAVVMIRDGEPRVVVKRETLDDVIKNDV